MTQFQYNLLKEKLDEMETILNQNPDDPSESRRILMNEVGILKYKVDLYSQQSMIRASDFAHLGSNFKYTSSSTHD